MSCGVILLAAGTGRRFRSSTAKQFVRFQGQPLFFHSFRTFEKMRFVRQLIVVVPRSRLKFVRRLLDHHETRGIATVVAGGRFRGASVARGLKAFPSQPAVVLIHDSARPLVTADVIRRVYQSTQKHGVALAAWPVSDTIKLSGKDTCVRKTIPRKNLWLAQTPQGFRGEIAYKCLLHPLKNATDDVELAQRKGHRVHLVFGDPHNIKVTYANDLKVAKALSRL